MSNRFTVQEPTGDDPKVLAAYRFLKQKQEREEAAFLDFCTALSPAAMGVAARALEFAEDRTEEALILLLNEDRDARRRENERPNAA